MLKKIEVSWPKISPKDDKVNLFSWLQYVPFLNFLDLSDLTLSDPLEVQSLITYLRSIASDNLRTLHLPRIIGDHIVEDLILSLWEHPYLERVHIPFTFSL